MTWSITKALLWKEWRESRLKFLALLLAFHLPLVGFMRFATLLKKPSHDLAALEQMGQKILYATLFYQSAFNLTVGIFLLSFFAGSAFAGEYENNRLFFVLERPIRRRAFLAVKSAVYGLEALVCISASLFTTQLIVYLAYNLDGSPLLAIPPDDLADVTGAGLRGAVWLVVLGLAAFACSFLFGVYFEKWWAGMVAATITIAVLLYLLYFRIYDWMLFSFVHPDGAASRSIDNYARLEVLPLGLMLTAALLIYGAAHYVFERKEIS